MFITRNDSGNICQATLGRIHSEQEEVANDSLELKEFHANGCIVDDVDALRRAWYVQNYDKQVLEIERDARMNSVEPDYSALDAAVTNMKTNIYPKP